MKKKGFLLPMLLLGGICLSGCTSLVPNDSNNGTDLINEQEVFSGVGQPSGEIGKIGDLYIDTSTWDVYTKGDGGWNKVGNIKGETGNGIVSISKTSSEGLIDTYTITYSNGETATFIVTNGDKGEQGIQGLPGSDGHSPVVSISSETGNWVIDGVDSGISATGPKGDKGTSIVKIEKTKTEGLVDTYTIYYSDETTDTFTVTNGEQGIQGIQGVKGDDGHSLVVSISPTTNNWVIDGVDSGVKATGKSAYELYLESHPDYKGDENQWLDDLINGRLGNKEKHTVKFNTGCDYVIEDQLIFHGEKVVKPSDPTREGYTFKYWEYQDEKWSFPGYVVTEDMTLNAVWDLNIYRVDIFFNNGEPNDVVDCTYKQVLDYEDPIKENYFFMGWEDTNHNPVLFPYTVLKDIEIFATYSNEINVTFDCNGGVKIDNSTIRLGIECDSLPVPVKDGAVFLGWFFEENGKENEIKTPFVPSFNQQNIVLKAHWRETAGDYAYEVQNDGNVKILGYHGTDVDLNVPSSIDNKNVATIGKRAFAENANINTINLPSNISVIENEAFLGMDSLKKVNFDSKTIECGENVFQNCNLLETLGFNCNVKLLSLFNFDNNSIPTSLKNLEIAYEETKDNVYVIRDTTFFGVMENKLFNLSIKEGPTVIKNFGLVPNIETLTLPNSLEILASNAFSNCDNLLSVNFNNGLKEIGYYAFYGCPKLNNIVIPNSVLKLGDSCFKQCYALSNITLSENITIIEDGAFWSCNSLTNLALPRSLKSLGAGAFNEDKNLEEVIFNEGLEYIGNSCFSRCYSLKRAILPNTIKSTGYYVFGSCESLTDVYIPSSINKIEISMFDNCVKLVNVSYQGTKEELFNKIESLGNDQLFKIDIKFNQTKPII